MFQDISIKIEALGIDATHNDMRSLPALMIIMNAIVS